MDLFFESLPLSEKLDCIFTVYDLSSFESFRISGRPNPLKLVAEKFRKEASVLCFDDFLSRISETLCCSMGYWGRCLVRNDLCCHF